MTKREEKELGSDPSQQDRERGGGMHHDKRRARDTHTFWLSLIRFRRTLIWGGGDREEK